MKLINILKCVNIVLPKKNFHPSMLVVKYEANNKRFVFTDSITLFIIKYDAWIDYDFYLDKLTIWLIIKINCDYWMFVNINWNIVYRTMDLDISISKKDIKYPEYEKPLNIDKWKVEHLMFTDKTLNLIKAIKALKIVTPSFHVLDWNILKSQDQDITILHRIWTWN